MDRSIYLSIYLSVYLFIDSAFRFSLICEERLYNKLSRNVFAKVHFSKSSALGAKLMM